MPAPSQHPDAARENEATGEDATTPVGEPVGRAPQADEDDPTRLGRYVVLGELGRGGMGRVLRAYDPKLQREVALKTLVSGEVSDEARRRMVREARAMAKLSHPNVVAVYDVDELGSGGVVLAMELVDGTTLKHWLTGQRSWREILEAFAAAGRGVAAAHAVGLLHRDFKPANVLVGEEHRIKVTDFGLARPAGATISRASDTHADDAELTSAGSVMGTPRYMAPEQHAGLDLDARADQYSFCVALWEALCGRPPFSGRLDEIERAKSDGPPPMSSALRRGAGPQHPIPRRIVAAIERGLSVDSSDRWPSMDALLEVIRHDPYRVPRRWLFGLSGGVLAVAAGSMAYQAHAEQARRCTGAPAKLDGVWDASRKDEIERAMLATNVVYAPTAWGQTASQIDQYAQDWVDHHTRACEATAIRGEQSQHVLDLRMACLHQAWLELQAASDLLAKADDDVVAKAQDIAEGLPMLSQCADVAALEADVEPPQPGAQAEAVEAARETLARASALTRAAKYDEALGLIEPLRTALDEIDYPPLRTEVLLAHGLALDDVGKYDEAEPELQEALESALEIGQWAKAEQAARGLVFVVGYAQERHAEGLAYAHTAKGLVAQLGKTTEATLLTRARLELTIGSIEDRAGNLDAAVQRHQAALEKLQHALGEDHLEVASAHVSLGNTLSGKGRNAEAEEHHRRALKIREKILGPQHPTVSMNRNMLGVTLFSQGKLEESIEHLTTAIAALEDVHGPRHPKVAFARGNLAYVYDLQGKFADAAREHRAALEIKIDAFGENHPRVASSRSGLANALYQDGKLEEAEVEARKALEVIEARLGANNPDVAKIRGNYALVLHAQKRYAEAAVELVKVVEALEEALGPDKPDTLAAVHGLGSCLIELPGRREEAIGLFERAWEGRQQPGIPAIHRAEAAFSLARALAEREPARALELGRAALAAHQEAGDEHHGELAKVEAWLGKHER